MNTLAEEFKKHLDSISPEQFKKEWDEIESLGLVVQQLKNIC